MNINSLKKQWPLEPIKHMYRFRNGAINRTYKVVTEKGAYVLRLYARTCQQDIAFEVALLKYLKGLPVPCIYPVRGKDIFEINASPSIIYNYILGNPRKQFTQDHHMQVGKFLAYFHKRGLPFEWRGDREAYYDFTCCKMRLFEQAIKKKFKGILLERFYRVFEDVICSKPDLLLPTGPIHVDIKPDNILFNDGKLSGVIDFDNAYIGPLLLDLAKSMVWFGIGRKHFSLQKAANIYDGYISIRKLTPLEYQELYKIMRFAFASHLYVDFYMKVLGKIPSAYFTFLMNDFYNSYLSFSKITEQEFYAFFKKKHD